MKENANNIIISVLLIVSLFPFFFSSIKKIIFLISATAHIASPVHAFKNMYAIPFAIRDKKFKIKTSFLSFA